MKRKAIKFSSIVRSLAILLLSFSFVACSKDRNRVVQLPVVVDDGFRGFHPLIGFWTEIGGADKLSVYSDGSFSQKSCRTMGFLLDLENAPQSSGVLDAHARTYLEGGVDAAPDDCDDFDGFGDRCDFRISENGGIEELEFTCYGKPVKTFQRELPSKLVFAKWRDALANEFDYSSVNIGESSLEFEAFAGGERCQCDISVESHLAGFDFSPDPLIWFRYTQSSCVYTNGGSGSDPGCSTLDGEGKQIFRFNDTLQICDLTDDIHAPTGCVDYF